MAEYVDIEIGEGGTNFMPYGPGVAVSGDMGGETEPHRCKFPRLPAPQLPDGYLR